MPRHDNSSSYPGALAHLNDLARLYAGTYRESEFSQFVTRVTMPREAEFTRYVAQLTVSRPTDITDSINSWQFFAYCTFTRDMATPTSFADMTTSFYTEAEPDTVSTTSSPIMSERTYEGQDYRRLDMRSRILSNVIFKHCAFYAVDFRGAMLQNVRFENCSLYGLDMRHMGMRGCVFASCSIEQCDLSQSHILSSVFSDGALYDNKAFHLFVEDTAFRTETFSKNILTRPIFKIVSFTNSTMTRNTFERGDLSSLVFSQGAIQSCTFTHCRLDVVSLHDISQRRNVVDNCVRLGCQLSTNKQVKCKACGEMRETDDIYKAGVCIQCSRSKSYSQKNTQRVGKESKLPPFSFEFEVVGMERSSDPDPIELLKHGFQNCSDGSVDAEYKSPIYLDAVAFSRILPLLDTLKEFVTSRCGTHVHVQFEHKERLQDHFDEVFFMLERHLFTHTRETIDFWGRYFTSYACHSSPTTRYNWLNVTSEQQPTIEFRLAKFENAGQFARVVRFTRRLARYLDKQLSEQRTYSEYTQIANAVLNLYQQALTEEL